MEDAVEAEEEAADVAGPEVLKGKEIPVQAATTAIRLGTKSKTATHGNERTRDEQRWPQKVTRVDFSGGPLALFPPKALTPIFISFPQ